MRTIFSFDRFKNPLNIPVKGKKIALLFVCLLLSIPFRSFSQSDTAIARHSPRKAVIMSACLPGLGQIYNKKYWKVPIIYAGAAIITYFAVMNADSMNVYKKAYRTATDNDPATVLAPYYAKYDSTQLLQIKNIYRHNLELTCIIGAGIYLLNIIDAAVDANLFDFNVDDNLSMKIAPSVFCAAGHYTTGLSFTFNFKQKKTTIFH